MQPPGGESPEDWLERYDSTPTIIPEGLPLSARMSLVVVIVVGGTETRAFYVADVKELEFASAPDRPYGLYRLFFTVPTAILRQDGVCPGFTA